MSCSLDGNSLSLIEELLFLSSRDQMDKVNKNLSPLVRTPNLDSELTKLRVLLDRLTVEYKAKKDAMENSVNPNNAGQ